MPADLDIASAATMRPIEEIAGRLGIAASDLELYGKYKAKLPLHLIDRHRIDDSKLILVSAISPTPAGEGKTTTSIGLAQGLNRIGKAATVVLREPSLGPVFGVKGGAAGGGYSQVLPMEDINLHFTGDFAAIEKSHNLLAALIDNNLRSRKYSLGIDPRTVPWKRVFDMNDRALRGTVTGLGGASAGTPRETGFDITAASEIMAILCLCEDLSDLKERLGNIFVGFTCDGNPVHARDLKASGAMAALLKDAIKPNLVQTLEGTPAIIHGGPFANIAQGTNTAIATRLGMSLSQYVVTEAGFGSDLGAEKFFDIKCASAGLSPAAVVLVATVRALRYHGGTDLKSINDPDPQAVEKGLSNLEKHIENMGHFGMDCVVAINRFATDTPAEIDLIEERCAGLGKQAIESDAWAQGGKGAEALAQFLVQVIDSAASRFRTLYQWNWPLEKKIEAIAKKIYGARAVVYTAKARRDRRTIRKLGLEGLPVCMAKTQYSLSDNPGLRGRPTDFGVTVREIEVAAGAGFLIPLTGEIVRMPGLPPKPAAENMDIDAEGKITGLF